MVKVILYNLLRSKYKVDELFVSEGTINQIIEEIMMKHPNMEVRDFESAVVFYHGKPIHHMQFSKKISDNDEIIITHFVGGG